MAIPKKFKQLCKLSCKYLFPFRQSIRRQKNVPCVTQMSQSQICAPFRQTKMRIWGGYCDQRSQYRKHKVKPQFWETEKNYEST